uniref:Radical SAM superfamily protein n=1 Tax=viral metagenome TaxID=1070528 RepID=A0A6H1ZR91_9ZZZZ
MNKSKIEWALNPDGTQGYTWNPITGCLNGCEYCYARKLANTRLRERYRTNKNLGYDGGAPRWMIESDPFYPRFWEDKLCEPVWLPSSYRRPKAKGIFACDMSDLFGIGVPEDWTQRVIDITKACPYHRFYLLTKQPQNLIKWSPFPDNCWVGVSATDFKLSARALYVGLDRIEAKVKFLSFEPLLGDVNVMAEDFKNTGVNWVIIGQQTPVKLATMPKIGWVEDIVRASDKAGIPVFLKDNLKPLLKNKDGWTPALYVGAREPDGSNEYLKQEMPNL